MEISRLGAVMMSGSEQQWQGATPEQLRKLVSIHQRIGLERNLDQLLPIVIEEISDLVGADRTSFFVVDWERMQLRTRFAQGIDDEGITIQLKMGIVGSSVLTRRLANVANAPEHPFFNPDVDQVLDFHTESILVAPVVTAENEVLGAIELLNKDSGRFTAEDETLLLDACAELADGTLLESRSAARAAAVIDGLCSLTRSERGSLFVLDQDQGRLISLFVSGSPRHDIVLNLRLGVAGLVAVTGTVLRIDDAKADGRFDDSMDRRLGYTTNNLLALPIVGKDGEIIGVAEIINKRDGAFTDADIEGLKTVIGSVAIAVENAMLFSEHERQFYSILQVMAASIDAKDTLTAGHSLRVAEIAKGVGMELGFTASELDVLEVAALLHDYGKLGIDDHILKKEGDLSADEYKQIQEHVTLTRKILGKMRFARKYRNVPRIAAAHHEYIDGSGYSSGLKEKEIPFMAKMITVADVFEALTADRHYRKAVSREEAIKFIVEGVGSKFDPHIVTALKRFCANAAQFE